MPARSCIVSLAALTLVILPTGCNPCGNVPWLSADKCVGATGATDPSTSDPSSTSSESSSTAPSTSDPTTSTGTLTGTDSSSGESSTSAGECGDGEVNAGEECDDGNKTPGDGCEPGCTLPLPTCGDGKVDPGEECDDANEVDTDACINCTAAACGDGLVRVDMEQCDEGALNGDYGHCAADCSGPGERCGDGMKNGPEDCDDGNEIDEDDCSNECVAPRIVFVTTATFSGNLGGLTGADEKCSIAGAGLGQPGAEWKAWLSDGATSAAQRIDNGFTGYYKRPDGMVVAHGWTDLTDGELLLPIRVTEKNATVNMVLSAWTNATPSGAAAGGDHCDNWTFGEDNSRSGHRGKVDSTVNTWTSLDSQSCASAYRLYCFEN